MIHTTHLPTDLQESIWKAYCVGLQERYILKYAPPFLDPIHELLQGSSNLVLDWMAHMLKCSHVKPAKAIVLIGPLGCGKGLFANLLRLLLGQENVSRTTTMQQARLDGTILVHIDECNLQEELSMIRDLLDPYQGPHIVPSYHRVFVSINFCSPLLNHSNAFHQRFTCIPCGRVQHPADFHAAMHDPVKITAFHQHLMKRQVSPELS